MLVTCLKRVGFFFRKGNVTSRHEPATLISWSLPRERDVTPYRSPGCADVLRGARADVTDFSYMTLMDTSAVKHNMLKNKFEIFINEGILCDCYYHWKVSGFELLTVGCRGYMKTCRGPHMSRGT